VFDPIRKLFGELPASKARGYKPGRFSFNVRGGRCDACDGDGIIKVEMHFLADVYIPCEVCKGKRYNRETLEVRYKGKNVADVLAMTVEEALAFFDAHPRIKGILQTLYDVGLGYVELGQPAPTLSGGEAQRIKLSRELAKRATGRTVYFLDEPTTGLHFDDVKKLLAVLQRLVDAGNTVIVIEHNLDVIKNADFIIDLGPEGGDAGGHLVATGTPEEVSRARKSYTAKYLRKVLAKK
ncbi:MAG TPA: excinuclease ABC subunit UvrA, partial [bacterium]|nr:excinuclease ABC subunit UvrA [bacterium]